MTEIFSIRVWQQGFINVYRFSFALDTHWQTHWFILNFVWRFIVYEVGVIGHWGLVWGVLGFMVRVNG